jgi:hypothetical protein
MPVIQVVTGVDWPATAAAIAGGVVGVTGIVAAVMQSRRQAKAASQAARKQTIIEVVAAAVHLREAVLLFRRTTSARRSWWAGVATGVDYAGRYLMDESASHSLIAMLIAGARDGLKFGGVSEQMQLTAAERYQQIVWPHLERLTAATTAVQLDEGGHLQAAAAKLVRCASTLADTAQSGERDYKRADSEFGRALRAFQEPG